MRATIQTHDQIVSEVMSEISGDYFPGLRLIEAERDTETVFAEIQAEIEAEARARVRRIRAQA